VAKNAVELLGLGGEGWTRIEADQAKNQNNYSGVEDIREQKT
jgi:hypothetical protein